MLDRLLGSGKTEAKIVPKDCILQGLRDIQEIGGAPVDHTIECTDQSTVSTPGKNRGEFVLLTDGNHQYELQPEILLKGIGAASIDKQRIIIPYVPAEETQEDVPVTNSNLHIPVTNLGVCRQLMLAALSASGVKEYELLTTLNELYELANKEQHKPSAALKTVIDDALRYQTQRALEKSGVRVTIELLQRKVSQAAGRLRRYLDEQT